MQGELAVLILTEADVEVWSGDDHELQRLHFFLDEKFKPYELKKKSHDNLELHGRNQHVSSSDPRAPRPPYA